MARVYFKGLLIAFVIGLLSFMATYYLTLQVSSRLVNQEYIKLEHAAKQISIRFQDAIDVSVNDLEALQAFYSAKNHQASQIEFNRYMAVLDIENRHYIQALSWVPFIENSQRQAFVERVRQYQQDFQITARYESGNLAVSKEQPYYTPVTFISPYDKNKAAQGFDLSSSGTRKASLLQAQNTGLMTTTSKIRLVQETGESYGFLLIAPVYKNAHSPDLMKERDTQLEGYVTGVFRIDSLMESARQQADRIGLELALFDLETQGPSLLYGDDNEQYSFRFDILVPDRHWQLNLLMSPSLKQQIEAPSITNWILLGGGIISLLLMISFYALQVSMLRSRHISQLSSELQSHNQILEKTVAERTLALSEKNALLNQNVTRLESQKQSLSQLMIESDIAKRKAENLAQDLARSNQDLDEFAYIASHDLKAPLRGINQLSQWMAEDIETGNFEEVPNILHMIISRVSRLETLLNDLLEYASINRDETSLVMLDSQALIEELFPLYAPPSGFELVIEGSLPHFKTARPPFEQVIRNLLNNAFKHHDKSKGKIQICCEEEERFYRFMVKDDGPGIKSDHYDDIFKMFKTLKSRDEVEGSGMGLALIKKIVEHHHGQIYVESILGEGSAFYFTWPKQIER